MARARNIKPSFFMNEDLAELDFGIRLLFIGLWTLADREGRLEDRPKRIKRELFPSDTIDVDEGLAQLAGFGFIDRYSVDEFNIISICKFVEHQKPHGTEKDSKYPDANGLFTVHERGNNGYVTGKEPENKRMNAGSNCVLTVKEQLGNGEGIVNEPCDNALNVDLLNHDLLNPECGIMNVENKTSADSGESTPPQRKPKSITAAEMTQSLEGLSLTVASDYIQHRKQKKAPLNATAWKSICREVLKTGATPDEVFAEAMNAGWAGFKAEWYANRISIPAGGGRGSVQGTQRQSDLGERNREVARRVAEKYQADALEVVL